MRQTISRAMWALGPALTVLLFAAPGAHAASTVYLSQTAVDREVPTRKASSSTYINLNVDTSASKWGQDLTPPQIDAVVLKLRCPNASCAAATWKLEYRYAAGDDIKNYYSSHQSVGLAAAPVHFDFIRANSPTLFVDLGADTGPLALRLNCASNCPALASSWPLASGIAPGTGRTFVLSDVAAGVLLPWYELHTHEDAPSAGIVNQYRADGTTVIPQGASIPVTNVVLKARVKASPGTMLNLEVEVRKTSEAFTNAATSTSPDAKSGAVVSIPLNLTGGDYHWQYRVVGADIASPWTAWRGDTLKDFTIDG